MIQKILELSVPMPKDLEGTAAEYCGKCGEWHVCGFQPAAPPCMGHTKVRDEDGKQTGTRKCGNPRTATTRVCRSHGAGGKATGGRPIEHGRYSKVLPTGLLARFEESLRDPALLSVRKEIALLDLAIEGFLKGLDVDEDGYLAIPDQKTQFRFQSLIATRRLLVASEWKAMKDAQQVMTIQQLNIVVARLLDILKKSIKDPKTLALVMGDIRMLVAGKGSEE